MTANTVTGTVAVRQKQDQLVGWVRSQQDEIAMAAASHVKPSAIVRVTQGALRRNPKLMAAAIANPQSLLYCLLDSARLGHEPDTDDYYLVPFGNEVQGIEGYKGIIERMFRAGGVSSVIAQVVRQHDRYAPRGENTPPFHEYDDFASPDERGPLRGAYAYAIFPGGRCSQVIRMGRAEIMEHKAKSRGSDKADSPWQVWEPAMWKKTVLRALEPYVPTSTEYRTAAAQPASIAHIAPPATPASAPEPVVDAEIVEDATDTPPAAAATPVQRRATPPAPAGGAKRQRRRDTTLTDHIQAHFSRLGFGKDERDTRLAVTAKLAGLESVASTNDLDDEAKQRVVAELEKCKDQEALGALLAQMNSEQGDG